MREQSDTRISCDICEGKGFYGVKGLGGIACLVCSGKGHYEEVNRPKEESK